MTWFQFWMMLANIYLAASIASGKMELWLIGAGWAIAALVSHMASKK